MLISAVVAISELQAQIKMYPNGNVGIQSSVTPGAALVVGGNTNNDGSGYKTYICSNNHALYVVCEGAPTNHSTWLIANGSDNLVDGGAILCRGKRMFC